MNKKEGPGKPKTINSLGDLKKLPIKTVVEKPQNSDKGVEEIIDEIFKDLPEDSNQFEKPVDKISENPENLDKINQEDKIPSGDFLDSQEIEKDIDSQEIKAPQYEKGKISKEVVEDSEKNNIKIDNKKESEKSEIEIKTITKKEAEELNNKKKSFEIVKTGSDEKKEEEKPNDKKESSENLEVEIEEKLAENEEEEKSPELDKKEELKKYIESFKWPPENSKELKSIKELQEKISANKKAESWDIKTKEKLPAIPKNIIEAFVKGVKGPSEEHGGLFESPRILRTKIRENISKKREQRNTEWAEYVSGHEETMKENKKKNMESFEKAGKGFLNTMHTTKKILMATPEQLVTAPTRMLRTAGKIGMWGLENPGKLVVGGAAAMGAFWLLKLIAIPAAWAYIVLKPEWDKANKGKK